MTDVNATLTLDRPDRGTVLADTGQPVEGHTERVSTHEFLAFVRRILAAMGRRVARADIEDLAAMAELRAEFDRHIEAVVARLRNDPDTPASWSEVGRAFGITKQAAQQRFGHVGGLRREGGQPAKLR